MLNLVQILLLLPLAGDYMPNGIIEFMYGISITIASLSFLKFTKLAYISSLIGWLTIDQDNYYLNVIGLESKSSFVNTYSVLGLMTIIPIVHLLLWPLYR
jgi:hypothetical protein